MRLVTLLVLIAGLGFCVFGLVATLEPMEEDVKITWRLIYGAGALLILIFMARMFASARAARSPR